ncbi:MAG TPA: SpoIIE family protein phosphatase, partial [Flavobacteriales bacterium]|nr:SpoIIE family protein phosphatase [Flavobacteriales bacterium]
QEDSHGEAYGTDRIESVLVDLSRAHPKEIVEAVITDLETHRGSEPYLDDIALLACRFKG